MTYAAMIQQWKKLLVMIGLFAATSATMADVVEAAPQLKHGRASDAYFEAAFKLHFAAGNEANPVIRNQLFKASCDMYVLSEKTSPEAEPDAVILGLARCSANLGNSTTAISLFEKLLEKASRHHNAMKQREAEIALEEARKFESFLIVQILDAEKINNITISIDGKSPYPAEPSMKILMNKGDHSFVLRAPGKKPWPEKFAIDRPHTSREFTVRMLDVDDARKNRDIDVMSLTNILDSSRNSVKGGVRLARDQGDLAREGCLDVINSALESVAVTVKDLQAIIKEDEDGGRYVDDIIWQEKVSKANGILGTVEAKKRSCLADPSTGVPCVNRKFRCCCNIEDVDALSGSDMGVGLCAVSILCLFMRRFLSSTVRRVGRDDRLERIHP